MLKVLPAIQTFATAGKVRIAVDAKRRRTKKNPLAFDDTILKFTE